MAEWTIGKRRVDPAFLVIYADPPPRSPGTPGPSPMRCDALSTESPGLLRAAILEQDPDATFVARPVGSSDYINWLDATDFVARMNNLP